jgi:hypothetical protein
METTYKWCDGCYYNQPNQYCHSCLTDYVNINDNIININIYGLFLTGNYYGNMSNIITIRLYQGSKFFGKIVINYDNLKYTIKGDQIIMERIVDYFL